MRHCAAGHNSIRAGQFGDPQPTARARQGEGSRSPGREYEAMRPLKNSRKSVLVPKAEGALGQILPRSAKKYVVGVVNALGSPGRGCQCCGHEEDSAENDRNCVGGAKDEQVKGFSCGARPQVPGVATYGSFVGVRRG